LDVSKKSSISENAEKCRQAHGYVTLLINNAGIVSGKTTLELSEPMIERTIAVNTTSHLYTIREFLPDMIKNKKGHIVSLASMAGLAGLPGLSDYCASKSGAVSIDESVRLELKKSGNYKYVKTTCICPYYINTGMFDGVKNAFPMYILSTNEVVARILNGIRQEEEQVIIPWRGNIVFIARLLPVWMSDWVGKTCGLGNCMDDFKGRGSDENRLPGIQ
jgi:all-trans-retinol dehydrogenase (NAD+)